MITPSGRRGLTLLELTIAVSLTAIMGAATVALVGRGLTAWQRADARLQQMFRAQKAVEQISGDLRNALGVADRPFAGDETTLEFVRSESAERLAQVRYRLEKSAEGGILKREREEFPNPEGAAPQGKVLLERLRIFALEYPARVGEGGEEEALIWQPVWVDPEEFHVPEMVRVTLECLDSQGGVVFLTREIWLPHGVLATATYE